MTERHNPNWGQPAEKVFDPADRGLVISDMADLQYFWSAETGAVVEPEWVSRAIRCETGGVVAYISYDKRNVYYAKFKDGETRPIAAVVVWAPDTTASGIEFMS